MASNTITLSVGGTLYTTSIKTLTRYPDSNLGTMFTTRSQLDPPNRDEHGRFFIDRDGPMFRYVLNFLRDSCLTLPKDFKDLDLLEREAEFYQIEPLIGAVKGVVDAAGDHGTKNKISDCIVVEYCDTAHWTLTGKKAVLDDILKHLGHNIGLDHNIKQVLSTAGMFEGYQYDGLYSRSIMPGLIRLLTATGFSVEVGCPVNDMKGTWVFRR